MSKQATKLGLQHGHNESTGDGRPSGPAGHREVNKQHAAEFLVAEFQVSLPRKEVLDSFVSVVHEKRGAGTKGAFACGVVVSGAIIAPRLLARFHGGGAGVGWEGLPGRRQGRATRADNLR